MKYLLLLLSICLHCQGTEKTPDAVWKAFVKAQNYHGHEDTEIKSSVKEIISELQQSL